MKSKGSLNLIREMNTSIILDVLKEKAPLSKYSISKITKLSAPTVSNIISDLIEVGFVKEVGMGESIGGRPPLLLDLNLEGGFVIGVDISSDNIKAIIVDFLGNIIAKTEVDVTPLDTEFVIFDKITLAISNIIKKSKKNRNLILGMGIGVAGDVDSQEGLIKHASRLKWNYVPIKSIIENSFHIPTYVDENVKLFTLAEHWRGSGRNYNNIVCIRVGDDIGAGIIIDGELFNGSTGGAGINIGHMLLRTEGEVCDKCGNPGCLHSLISSNGIVNRAKKALSTHSSSLTDNLKEHKELTVKAISESAKKGDHVSIQIMNETGKYLATAILNIVSCLDPEIVIVGGGISEAGDVLFDPLNNYLKEYIQLTNSKFRVVKSKLGVDAYAMGAATAVLKQIFQFPGKFIN